MALSPSLDSGIRRPRPRPARGIGRWLRHNLFADRLSICLTLLIGSLLLYCLPPLVDWAIVKAVFRSDSAACRLAAGEGACWGVVAEKYPAILLGRYPPGEQWRAVCASALLLAAIVATCRWINAGKILIFGGLTAIFGAFALLRGGWAGLSVVDSSLWGGLPLTLLLAIVTVLGACPLAVLLALGRRSQLPAIRLACGGFIELVRAVPLVSVLLLVAFLLPLFLPAGSSIDVLWRVMIGLVLFAAAYLAEVLRGGLQSIPRGHLEAAAALGLSYWQTQIHVVLPQAIRATLPALMNNFISVIKETSLVTVVSLFELTGALNLALIGDVEWREFYVEAYLFVAAIYWLLCFSLSRYSQRLALRLRTDRSF
jgi:general L-amino acid transport system permease protein